MNDLGNMLRAHDPARGKVLDGFDRSRILHAVGEGARRHTRTPLRIAAILAMLVLLITVGVALRRSAHHEAARQIQMATPGGTRIVWTLDPNFHM